MQLTAWLSLPIIMRCSRTVLGGHVLLQGNRKAAVVCCAVRAHIQASPLRPALLWRPGLIVMPLRNGSHRQQGTPTNACHLEAHKRCHPGGTRTATRRGGAGHAAGAAAGAHPPACARTHVLVQCPPAPGLHLFLAARVGCPAGFGFLLCLRLSRRHRLWCNHGSLTQSHVYGSPGPPDKFRAANVRAGEECTGLRRRCRWCTTGQLMLCYWSPLVPVSQPVQGQAHITHSLCSFTHSATATKRRGCLHGQL